MSRTNFFSALLSVLIAALMVFSNCALASGGDGYSENIYTPENHVPESELTAYAASSLSISSASYWRVYHFLKYRALTGHALSQKELEYLHIEGWRVGAQTPEEDYAFDSNKYGINSWKEARKSIPNAADVKIDAQVEVEDYQFFLNCHRDAFERASKTLAQRLAQGGQKWAAVWLANQDTVFSNCSPLQKPAVSGLIPDRPLVLPAALPKDAPEWLIKDYAYQKASALFYASRYDEARLRFLDIAKDADSPWQSLGNYLAARCLIRKGSLLMADESNKSKHDAGPNSAALLETARKELIAISLYYTPAKDLVSWIDIRLHPEDRRRELSAILASEKINSTTWKQLSDYLILLDRVEDTAMIEAKDDMSAWIGIMQTGYQTKDLSNGSDYKNPLRKKALDIARANWNKNHKVQWLVAILANVNAAEVTADETKAANDVREDSAAYGMTQYHLARLYIANDKIGDADVLISAMLKKHLQPSVRNRWLRMKMVTAKTPEEFFAAAPRVIVEDRRYVPIPNEGKAVTTQELTFDDDFRQHLMAYFSLGALKRFKPMIPMSQQTWVNEMMWARAVILGDYSIADELTDELKKGRNTTSHLYERFKKAATPIEKKQAAMVILANTPELTPYVADTILHTGYWSCERIPASIDDMALTPPAFLSDGMLTQAKLEIEELRKTPKRSIYLIPQIIEWAKQNKTDPEAPKALHFLVASTRNECGMGAFKMTDGDIKTAEGQNFSKRAFQFLHSQFPNSEWTTMTRYYY